MRILLDTNLLLDVLLRRDPWQADAAALWQAVDDGQVTAYVPASAITDIFYVAKRLADLVRARQSVQLCLDAFNVGTVDRAVVEGAQALSGLDFGDNVQIACAELNGLDAIVTRDPNDYEGSPIAVWSPSECLKRLQSKTSRHPS